MSRCFSPQLDESVGVVNLANLLIYVRYEFEGMSHEEFLFCKLLPTRTTGEHIFQLLNDQREWSGVVAQIREVAPDMKWTHCSIHREALAAKKMAEDLKSVLDSAVKVVNSIKAQPMNSRLFSVLCNEMGNEHVQLLLHAEVRWLSLNELNMGLQGLSLTIFDMSDKITAMKKKLQLFVNKINTSDVSAFPTLENYLHTYGVAHDAAVRDVIAVHLLSLKEQFSEYFPVEATPEWIRNPFTVDVLGIPKDWIYEYPALSLKAVRFLMPFTTAYLCEKGFSTPTAIKTKYRNKMDAESDLRLKLTALVPGIARLRATKQSHPSLHW
ncbi:ZBED5 protein, partial [Atractosteus spatula]|nr:ZBED5 protein [Atractosteus spatula]